MKKLHILLGLIMFSTGLWAQGPGQRKGAGEHNLSHLDSIVHLTAGQKEQIREFHAVYRDSMMKAKEAGDQDRMDALHKAMRTQVHSVLTDEQRTTLKEHRTEKMQKMKAMQAELRAFHETHFKPAMKAKREAFEQLLNEDEKAAIDEARKKMAAYRAQMQTDSFHPGPHGGIHHFSTGVRDDLQPIIQKYDSVLQPIRNDLAELHRKLEPGIREIRSKYMPEDKPMHPGHKKGNRMDGAPGKQGQMKADKNDHVNIMLYHFLLMN